MTTPCLSLVLSPSFVVFSCHSSPFLQLSPVVSPSQNVRDTGSCHGHGRRSCYQKEKRAQTSRRDQFSQRSPEKDAHTAKQPSKPTGENQWPNYPSHPKRRLRRTWDRLPARNLAPRILVVEVDKLEAYPTRSTLNADGTAERACYGNKRKLIPLATFLLRRR